MITKPIYIFGPCSAETREQVLTTARQLKEACGALLFIFRAGAWKPRTSPHSFQGAGDEALDWLREVKETLNLPVATEVVSPEHVRKALAAGIDYLWIGARTSANPIAVQAIADCLSEKQSFNETAFRPKAVFIKNPVNADANLWLGNIERLEQTGLPVIAVHRGCNHRPCWAMAHAVRMARPDIPLLLDPSHMSGDAEQVPALLSKITELGLDGVMMEVHCNPEEALSDKKQQLPPSRLPAVLLPISSQLREINASNTELIWLRAEIDELDDSLWETLAARMDVSRRIGEWKKANHITPLQPERYAEILAKRTQWAEKHELDAEFVQQLFDLIHKESLKRQE